jgi:hypothetical protein
VEWAASGRSPYAIGELATLGQTPYDTSNFNKPVQVDIAGVILRLKMADMLSHRCSKDIMIWEHVEVTATGF